MRSTIKSLVIGLVATYLAVGLVWVKPARADGPEVSMVVIPPDAKDPKHKEDAPSIEVTVVGGPTLPLDKFTLTTTNAKLGAKVTIPAAKLRPYAEGKETIAIALVLCGQMVWIGTKDYNTEVPYEGALKNLEAAIDKLQLGSVGPPGSKGVVISYSQGANTVTATTDLKNINGAALGSQKDYEGKIGSDLVQGITQGLAELQKVATARKALIVVGDGFDTDPERAKTQLAQMKKDAAKQNIQMFAVIYRSEVTPEGNGVITAMIPGAKTVSTSDGIFAELNSIIEKMKERYYLTFPGQKDELYYPFDGKEHDMVLKIDQAEAEAVPLTLSPTWAPPKGMSLWWLWIVIPVFLLIVLIILVKVFGGKEAPAPAPMPMPVMAAPAPEAPKPLGPMKTVILGQDGSADGFPVVGWLVPLNGSNAYQTFRLRSGGTKIGTQAPADIVINDGFMSTDHCMIQCSPQGFTLVDGGSTNGCYVNDRKVSKHDLVDNDLVTLGKTNLKFKSIV